MKKIFSQANKLIVLLFSTYVLLCSTSCKYDATGTETGFIYPKEGIANVRTVTQSCPIQVSEKVVKNINELDGWVCVPPEYAQKMRRAHEKENCGGTTSLRAAQQEATVNQFLEEENANIILRIQQTAD